jgi:hypothetical protein
MPGAMLPSKNGIRYFGDRTGDYSLERPLRSRTRARLWCEDVQKLPELHRFHDSDRFAIKCFFVYKNAPDVLPSRGVEIV